MAPSRKMKRGKMSRRSRGKKMTRRVRKHRGGGTINLYCLAAGTGVPSNFYSNTAGVTLRTSEAVGTANGTVGGKVRIVDTTGAKITGVTVQALKDASSKWEPETNLITAPFTQNMKVSSSSKSLMGRSAIAIPAGTLLHNINITGLPATASWGGSPPFPAGQAAPTDATGGTGNVNVRIRITTA